MFYNNINFEYSTYTKKYAIKIVNKTRNRKIETLLKIFK